MTFIRTVLVLTFALFTLLPSFSHAGNNNTLYSNAYGSTRLGNVGYQQGTSSGYNSYGNSGHREVLESNSGSWEPIVKKKSTPVFKQAAVKKKSPPVVDGAARYLNNFKNSAAYANNVNRNVRYNSQYGGYEIQNQINIQRERNASRLTGYNFFGNPANYRGAAYQNFRGYGNFAAAQGGYPNYGYDYGYDFGMYDY